MTKFNTPILLVAWRRPYHLRHVIDAIRKVAPTKMFVAVDGPRLGDEHANERRLIEETKEVIEKEIDWECEIMLNYQVQNLGCRVGVSTAITWFFEHVEEGIILEDDCVPSKEFFRFVEEMLAKYRDDDQIMHITGNNFNGGKNFNKDSYFYSIYNHVWGWATWRKSWSNYCFGKSYWLELKESRFLNNYLEKEIEINFWTKYFDEVFIDESLNTWDYVWRLNIWSNQGLTVTPNENLVRNIGFDELATHTKNGLSEDIGSLSFPLKHPKKIQINKKADDRTFRKQIAVEYIRKYSTYQRLIRKLKNILK